LPTARKYCLLLINPFSMYKRHDFHDVHALSPPLPMENTPVPRRDLFHPSYSYANIQTTRGCPMRCDFCSVHTFNGSHYRERPVEEVLDELETIPHEKIYFVERHNVVFGRTRAPIDPEKFLRGLSAE
jgi:radical SAM superfamily enzyme YgiQ (UPF0313 family)